MGNGRAPVISEEAMTRIQSLNERIRVEVIRDLFQRKMAS